MSPSDVFVYSGLGSNENGCFHLLNSLKTHLHPDIYKVDLISAEDIIEGSKLTSAALLTFGSGYTTGFVNGLGAKGMQNLRDFVLGGGSYLGLGAGGYFGCDYIEFDKNGPLEKMAERELRFYPGIGRGPVYPGFQYGSNKGLHAANITFSTGNFTATFSSMIDGGGAFYPSDPPKLGSPVTSWTKIAIYTDITDQPTAIVKMEVGSGCAVLSGVHLEYDMLIECQSDPSLHHLQPSFTSSRLTQRAAMKAILQLLGLIVR
ncbi:biotin--protein ligase [Biomphalaria glabrata]|nr:biotin--protein ligase [Biomphalaria glabrata]